MSEFVPITSSNLQAASYNAETQALVVKFKNGTAYQYENVSAGLYNDFCATFDGTAEISAGKFFNANIRKLPCQKIEVS